MGPFRVAWSFPYTVSELIEACNKKEARLAKVVDTSLTEEEDFNNEIADYRERLRVAGVDKWETALPDRLRGSGMYSSRTPDSAFKDKQRNAAKQITEIQKWRRQLEHDQKIDAHRQFKLSIDDIDYFEL